MTNTTLWQRVRVGSKKKKNKNAKNPLVFMTPFCRSNDGSFTNEPRNQQILFVHVHMYFIILVKCRERKRNSLK